MGTFFFLFVFAAANVALGTALGLWWARTSLNHVDEELNEITAEQANSEPAADASPKAGPETPSTAASASSDAPIATDSSTATAEQPTSPPQEATDPPDEPSVDTAQLGYEDLIDHAAAKNPIAEALDGILKLDVQSFRESLLAAERAFRDANADDELLCQVFAEMKSSIDAWLPTQSSASARMEECTAKTDVFGALELPLDKLLCQATDKLESKCQTVQSSEDVSRENAAKIRRQIIGLIDACHDLRDAIQISFANVVTREENFAVDERLRNDPSTGMANRAGLEMAITEWWQTEERQGDAASLVVIDLDGMAQLNQQLGLDIGDELIKQVAGVIREELKSERGFDVPARLNGQRFAALFGYQSPRRAAAILERIRQALELAGFETESGNCEVRCSCAATALQKGVSLEKHLESLNLGLEFAKERGGNCTAIWADGEAEHFDAVETDATPRTIKVNAPSQAPPSEPEESPVNNNDAAERAESDPDEKSDSADMASDDLQPVSDFPTEVDGDAVEGENTPAVDESPGGPEQSPAESHDTAEPGDIDPAKKPDSGEATSGDLQPASESVAEVTGDAVEGENSSAVDESTNDAASASADSPEADDDADDFDDPTMDYADSYEAPAFSQAEAEGLLQQAQSFLQHEA